MPNNYPRHIDSWIDLLSRLEIPILKQTNVQINKLQQNIDSIDLRDLSILIRHDPLLSLKLLKHQETKRRLTQTTDVTTIEKVLLMIGIRGFFNAFGGTHHIEDILLNKPLAIDGCHQSCYRAFFASQVADQMSKHRRDLDPNEIITAALLHETAEILLWQLAPELLSQIKDKLKKNRELRSRDVQNEILGCTLNDLQQRLCTLWNLPKILIHLASEQFENEPRVQLVKLATSIARHTEWDLKSEYYQTDIKTAAEFLEITPDEAHKLVVNAALSTAKDWEWYEVQPTAARLIF